LAGLCFLARNDFLLVLIGLAVMAAIYRPRPNWRVPLAAILSGSILSLPWLLYCRTAFGSWMPISGKATTFITYWGYRPYQVWNETKIRSLANGILSSTPFKVIGRAVSRC
jgi:hypothetical protein